MSIFVAWPDWLELRAGDAVVGEGEEAGHLARSQFVGRSGAELSARLSELHQCVN